jgi:hypothetical protein
VVKGEKEEKEIVFAAVFASRGQEVKGEKEGRREGDCFASSQVARK